MREQHFTTREGTVTGVLGAILVSLWYFVFDLAAGVPFRTSNVLGKVLFRGDLASGVHDIVPEIVISFTIVHVLVFVLAGLGLTFLVHLSTRDPSWRMGVWIGLVCAFAFFAGVTFMMSTATAERMPLWSVLGGNALGIVGMAWYLWRRHPRLEQSFHEAPLGSEVPAPSHPHDSSAVG